MLKVDSEVVSLVKRHIGSVYIPNTIVDELSRCFDLEDINELGLEILEVSDETRYEALKLKEQKGLRKLSEQDVSCLLTARQINCVCVTNDRLLRNACADFGISILWELEVILKLYENGGFTYERSERYVETLYRISAYITDEIVAIFRAELNKLRNQKNS